MGFVTARIGLYSLSRELYIVRVCFRFKPGKAKGAAQAVSVFIGGQSVPVIFPETQTGTSHYP
jgi:hypothetical protein